MKGNYFDIDEHGSFVTDNPMNCYDEKLNAFLLTFLKNKSVIDFGCGDAKYLHNLKNNNTTQVDLKGYDGNPFTEKLTDGIGETMDLTSPIQFANQYQWAISFEVGEHIPKPLEKTFIDNLCNAPTEGIIISWAIEGQPGEGHINCRNNDYVIEQLYSRKFLCDLIVSSYLRSAVELWWFKTNLLVFYKVNTLITSI